ncbi:MAG: hypothetical protein U0531_09995 [Dehalococcoidia bacterium]
MCLADVGDRAGDFALRYLDMDDAKRHRAVECGAGGAQRRSARTS